MTVSTMYASPWHAAVGLLVHRAVSTVFGLPGDDLGLLHALESTDVRMILCRDQRGAMFMATGYAMQSGTTGVCVVGKGPALTNVLTGLLEARSSGVPVVVLAGGTAAARRDAAAFQELDQLPLVTPLVKWAARVDHPDRLIPLLEKAFLMAGSGAPGPVYLEIPDELTSGEIVRNRPWASMPEVAAEVEATDQALELLRASRRPVLLVGGGMRGRNADGRLEAFADRIGAAIFTTASGRGVVDEDHPAFCGLAGLYSPAEAGPVWRNTDLLVTVGSRLEETATYGSGFASPGVPVLQVNLDAAGMSTDLPGATVLGEGAAVVASWQRALGSDPANAEWRTTVAACRTGAQTAVANRLGELAESGRLHVAEILATLDRTAPPDRILVQENGLQDMWSYFFPYWTIPAGAGSIVPSEQTTLGFGTAAAGGVKLAAGARPVVAFVGDGAFAMVAADVATLAEHGVGVLYIVLRNRGYGWLQSQLDQHGDAATRFRFLSQDAALTVPAHPAVWHTVVAEKAGFAEALGQGLLESSKGRVAVLEVPLTIDDVPPGIEELDGDFPGAAVNAPPTPVTENGADTHER
ncbi:thiamine pyrophosphate-binding protein [Amycolatopsis panacis]|uniref:Thiamine pyrophosphate-binding protein n=1 Tax=Amycolatopsis panacis TaxID=2340917 RepID=A0A419HWF2_9PSEU|nr:thiamine pyrophosphate-binding protein [Amycolatopsis panacis]RJQ81317.1 thiamine pyrophosphate-binding protein [Amycolatopsis panacis]